MDPLKKLHDATLTEVHLDWEKGELHLQVEPSQIYTTTPLIRLVVTDLKNFVYPRKLPWGPSVSINTVSVKNDQGDTTLFIEMQSGDVIEIAGKQFSFEPPLEKLDPPATS